MFADYTVYIYRFNQLPQYVFLFLLKENAHLESKLQTGEPFWPWMTSFGGASVLAGLLWTPATMSQSIVVFNLVGFVLTEIVSKC